MITDADCGVLEAIRHDVQTMAEALREAEREILAIALESRSDLEHAQHLGALELWLAGTQTRLEKTLALLGPIRKRHACDLCGAPIDPDNVGVIGGARVCLECYPAAEKAALDLADRRATIRDYVEEKKR